MTTVERAIADMVATQVAEAEKRILERLSIPEDKALTFSKPANITRSIRTYFTSTVQRKTHPTPCDWFGRQSEAKVSVAFVI
ncbi:hypothetical protein P7H15_10940 [Paenibacillus larvae]|nr:hypothetical protein [Paenibacillus larvae]MDT2293252.1 hypothetical protein [Paenibacillus larvae]